MTPLNVINQATRQEPSLSDDDIKRRRGIEKLERELGPVVMAALRNPNVIEIMLNPDGKLWVEAFGAGKQVVGHMLSGQASGIVATTAALLGTVVTSNHPQLEGELPIDGSRFTALIPPVVAAPSFTIRKKAVKIFRLEDYHASGIITAAQLEYLRNATKSHRNIMVVGATGSGKTTLLNALIASISEQCPDDRLVIIEDTGELQCSAKDSVTLRATVDFSMNRCLRATMRLRPDRIIVGEVRGGEGMALLKAWNTGHEGGAGTVHASSAMLGLARLQSLVSEAPEASNFTPGMLRSLISEAVHVVVFIQKDPEHGRKIKEIIEIQGFNQVVGEYLINPVV